MRSNQRTSFNTCTAPRQLSHLWCCCRQSWQECLRFVSSSGRCTIPCARNMTCCWLACAAGREEHAISRRSAIRPSSTIVQTLSGKCPAFHAQSIAQVACPCCCSQACDVHCRTAALHKLVQRLTLQAYAQQLCCVDRRVMFFAIYNMPIHLCVLPMTGTTQTVCGLCKVSTTS